MIFGMLVVGLSPFQSPPNGVSWLEHENGIRIGPHGIVLGPANVESSTEQEEKCSIEIWVKPLRSSLANTLLAFATSEEPLQLSLRQYRTTLFLQKPSEQVLGRRDTVGVADMFNETEPSFITLTSGRDRSAVYLNGCLRRVIPGFSFRRRCAGQVVLGSSPVDADDWRGRIYGLAFYKKDLTPDQVSSHFSTWTRGGGLSTGLEDRPFLLYLFDEHAGSTIHDSTGAINLDIPRRYVLPHQYFLEPFWKEYRQGWPEAEDLLVNIFGFVPLGLIFRLHWTSIRRVKNPVLSVAILGLAVSLTIEVFQSFISTRNSGTMDLITNTLGTLLGIGLFQWRPCRSFAGRGLGVRLNETARQPGSVDVLSG